MLPDFIGYLAETKANIRTDLYDRAVPLLSDFGDGRLEVMDRHSVDYVVLSLSGPGVQIEADTARATRLARRCNDRLALETQKRPDRYGGFAHLALQDPGAAADELARRLSRRPPLRRVLGAGVRPARADLHPSGQSARPLPHV